MRDDVWPLDISSDRQHVPHTRVGPAPVGLVHFGLGPIGRAIARLTATHANLTSVGAVDNSSDVSARPFGDVLGVESAPHEPVIAGALSDVRGLDQAHVAIHATGSSLAMVTPQILECVSAGLNVVSTCEELSYPWLKAPDLAAQLDEAARQHGVTVLGTGVNPGFAMDYLPVVLSGAVNAVEQVRVLRVQDAGMRREPLQRKVGAGLDVATFRKGCRSGAIRHVGLTESLHAIASAFGWTLTEERETIEPITADKPTPSAFGDIAPGNVTGLRQVSVGHVNSREAISLVLEMAVGLSKSRDEIALEGDPDVRMTIPFGLHGDRATAAVIVNTINGVMEAGAGLLTMTDLPVAHPYSVTGE